MLDQKYSGEYKRVVTVNLESGRANARVPLSDQTGEVSMILTVEQLNFIKSSNTPEGYKALLKYGYLKQNALRTRYFPFVFDGSRLVLIHELGKYGRLLTIGTDPLDSEAYRLLPSVCNRWTLSHCFPTRIDPVRIVLPLFQPPVRVKGQKNYWSIRLEYVK